MDILQTVKQKATHAADGSLSVSQRSAIDELASRIQDVGEYKSRLITKENTLAIAITNTENVRSNIEDADFAKEQMEVMKLSILQQTAMTSLTQANSGPQIILSLFR